MAPSRPLAELTSVSVALPTMPFSSVVTTGAEVDEGVTGASFVDEEVERLGDIGDCTGAVLFDEGTGTVGGARDVEEDGEGSLEITVLLMPIMGEFDGVGLVDLYSSTNVPSSVSSASESTSGSVTTV